jgi:adenylate kinase family enzyme
MERNKLGNKIVVLGVSASGKSTFARKLGKKIGLPVTHMDALMWKPGWEYIGEEETVTLIKEVSEKDQWIIEGYIEKKVRVELFTKVNTILYLDYPGWLSAWRYVNRTLKHRKNPRPELPGSPETFKFSFLKIVFTKGEVYKLEKLFKEHNWDSKIIRFKSPKESKVFLSKLH